MANTSWICSFFAAAIASCAIAGCGDGDATGGTGGGTSASMTSGGSKTIGVGSVSVATTATGQTATAQTTSTNAATSTTVASTVASSSASAMITTDGQACAKAEDCDGGGCFTEESSGIPGGMCAEVCRGGTCSNPNSVCVPGPEEPVCLRKCDPNVANSCGEPATLRCVQATPVTYVCVGGCQVDGDCTLAGNVCNPNLFNLDLDTCGILEICDNGINEAQGMDFVIDCVDPHCENTMFCTDQVVTACSAPPTLSDGVPTMGTTVGGVTAFSVDMSCGTSTGLYGPGQLFQYTASAAGNAEFVLVSMADQGLAAHSACDNNQANVLSCSDLVQGGMVEKLTVPVAAGQTIFVAVHAFIPSLEGSFELTASLLPP